MTRPLPLLLLAAVLAGPPVPAPQSKEGGGPRDNALAAVAVNSVPVGASASLASRPVGAEGPVVGSNPTTGNGGQSEPAPLTEGGVGTALMAGNIGWAEPDLGIDYLATRFPRGTLVEICGPNACLIRRTNDYGPVASIRPNRIADLAVLDWERICGLPRTRGLCPGTVETVAEIVLPATDTEGSTE